MGPFIVSVLILVLLTLVAVVWFKKSFFKIKNPDDLFDDTTSDFDKALLTKDPDIAIKKACASARLMDAFSRSALTLQRLKSGGGQTIQVQYMQVNAMVGDASGKIQNPLPCVSKHRGGRPPTSGYRTQEAINQRSADRELLSSMKRVEDIG